MIQLCLDLISNILNGKQQISKSMDIEEVKRAPLKRNGKLIVNFLIQKGLDN